jgi:RNA polymerase sigma factor for flagellar operon FliA
MGTGLPAHIEEADLISYGLLGLIGALERFDLSRNIKFETYAISRIKGSIIDELRALDWVPRSVRSWARQVERAVTKLENQLRHAPADEEIAAELGVTVDEFQDILTQISCASIVALDEFWNVTGSAGDKVTLMDTIEDTTAPDPSRAFDIQAVKELLAEAIRRLPEREKIVIGLYYYEGLTLKEIGEVLGVTESRVSQLHTKAVLRLKGRIKDELEPGSLRP